VPAGRPQGGTPPRARVWQWAHAADNMAGAPLSGSAPCPAAPRRLQIQGLPTLIFISADASKSALRTEGLLPADTIKNIVQNEL